MTVAPASTPSFAASYGPWLGLGLGLAGMGLSALGQYQGARAMEREAARQAAEQEALSREWYQRYHALLSRMSPWSSPASMQANLVPLLRLANPSGQAAPSQASALAVGAARRLSDNTERYQEQHTLRQMGVEQDEIARRQREQAALYPLRSQAAGMKGAGWRLAGDLMSGVGIPVMSMGFAHRQNEYLDARYAQRKAELERERAALLDALRRHQRPAASEGP